MQLGPHFIRRMQTSYFHAEVHKWKRSMHKVVAIWGTSSLTPASRLIVSTSIKPEVTRDMKKLLFVLSLAAISAATSEAQILLSGGLTYSQNFDSLATSATTTVPWNDDSTIPGWYASRATTVSGGAYGPFNTPYRVSGGELNNGSTWSFGTNGVNPVTDRAFGSISSGTVGTNAWGVRFKNDTASPLANILISYTGEQWRNGGNTASQPMTFTYQVSGSPLSGLISALANDPAYTVFGALTFTTPITGATATQLDGNDPANRVQFSSVLLTGVTLNPGEELMLRWFDVNDQGNDHGFGVDDFSVSFSAVPEPTVAVLGGLSLMVAIIWRRRQ